MSRVRILFMSGLTAAATMVATPALAVIVTGTVNFVNGSNTVLSDADNQLASNRFTITQSDPTKPALTVTAQGWNATASTAGKYTLSREYVGQYVGGLGVTTAANDYEGAYGLHQTDNVGPQAGTTSIDFVLLTFNTAVNLTSLTRNSYGIGPNSSSLVYDNDFSYGYLSSAPTDNGSWASLPSTIWSPKNLSTCGGTTTTGSGASAVTNNGGSSSANCLNQTQALSSTSAYATQWLVAASFLSNYGDTGGTGTVDGFKLASVSVKWDYITPPSNQTAVPEPATWAQMILGFGLAGVGLRRRRLASAAA